MLCLQFRSNGLSCLRSSAEVMSAGCRPAAERLTPRNVSASIAIAARSCWLEKEINSGWSSSYVTLPYKGFSFVVCLPILTLILIATFRPHTAGLYQAIVSIYWVELFVPPWLLVIGVSQTSLMVGGFRSKVSLALWEEETDRSAVLCGEIDCHVVWALKEKGTWPRK